MGYYSPLPAHTSALSNIYGWAPCLPSKATCSQDLTPQTTGPGIHTSRRLPVEPPCPSQFPATQMSGTDRPSSSHHCSVVTRDPWLTRSR